MALSVFDDKARPPDATSLKRVLGRSAAFWSGLTAQVAADVGPVTEEWTFPGAKYGWSMRLRHKDRVVVYMTPQDGSFLVGVVLGEKAVKTAGAAHPPPGVMALIAAAPRYAEGRGIRVTVSSRPDLDIVRSLVTAKMAPQPKGAR